MSVRDGRPLLDSASVLENTAQPNAASLPVIGEVIAEKYAVEQTLGKGGMGVVVVARHLELNKRVALKFLLPEAAELPNAVPRFLREARASVAIESEYVAKVEDVGRLETGMPYMVMELLHGDDLRQLLKKRKMLPIEEAVDLFLQACIAVSEAHALGIIHRDLKPANLFVTARRDGTPLLKVLDFGLAKVTEGALGPIGDGSLTNTHMMAGSPQYQSPEQYRNLKEVTYRADIWSLGVILYRMLTGRRPFEGPNLTAICVSVVTDVPPPPCSLRPEIPEGLEAVILRCLEKSEHDRYGSVAELARAVAPFGSERAYELAARADVKGTLPPLDAPASQAAGNKQAGMREAHASSATLAKSNWEHGEQPSEREKKSGSKALLFAVAGIVVLAAIGWGVMRNQGQASAQAPPEASSAVAEPVASSAPQLSATGALPQAEASAASPSTSAAMTAASASASTLVPSVWPRRPFPPNAPRPAKPGDPLDQWE